ncbi:MAG: hypothetical protein WAX29_09350 [Propionibacterium sp.]
MIRDSSTVEEPADTVPSTGTRPPGGTAMVWATRTSSRGTECEPPASTTRTLEGRKDMRSVSTSRPRAMHRSSRISAASTNALMTRAVIHWPMAAAAAMAMSMDRSMLIRWARTSRQDCAAIGQHPVTVPAPDRTATTHTGAPSRLMTPATTMSETTTASRVRSARSTRCHRP